MDVPKVKYLLHWLYILLFLKKHKSDIVLIYFPTIKEQLKFSKRLKKKHYVVNSKIENRKETPLITITELKTLNTFEAIVLHTRMLPFRTKLLPDYQIDWGYQDENIEIPTREKNIVSQYELEK